MCALRRITLAVPLLLVAGCSELDSPTAPLLEPHFSDTPAPTSVIIAGSLQSELGCPGDWDPACEFTGLAYDAGDGVWQRVFTVPAGYWEYKAALNGSWDENYGLNATRNGSNIPLSLSSEQTVKFYYDHETHWLTTSLNSVIAVAAGSFQSELGCPGDWQPDCLQSWLQDPDGDGIYTFTAHGLTAGNYEAKVAIAESWSENYGEGGVPNGNNIAFTVPAFGVDMLFSYVAATKVLTVGVAPPDFPDAVTIAGSLQSELGCAGDWEPSCTFSELDRDPGDDVYQATFSIPAGLWEYKVALNNSWDENYGAHAVLNGPNLSLYLSEPQAVTFYYHPVTHWVTSDRNSVIAVAAGSFQSELGCPGDWQPDCLRSWLMDADGDGTYGFTTDLLPAGNYEVRVAIAESWSENYGAGGVPNGSNIAFTVAANGDEIVFTYNATTHVLTVGGAADDAPTVVSTLPAPGASAVNRAIDLVVTFSEEVDVVDPWFTLVCASALQSFTYGGGPTSFTIDPADDLPPGASCTATVLSSGVGDRDLVDPPHSAVEYSWSFTTAPPALAEQFEAVGALIVAVVADAGVERSMLSKLLEAHGLWEAGDSAGACTPLNSLLNQISGLKGKKKLSTAAANQLGAAIAQLQATIGC